MNDHEHNPPQASKDDLLHFLDGTPRRLRDAKISKLATADITETEACKCPKDESYIKLALGSVQGAAAETLLAHAAECDHCGETLQRNLEAMEGTPSTEELAAISEMAAMREEWQDKLAHTLAMTHKRRRPFVLRGPSSWLMLGGAIAAVLAGVAAMVVWQVHRNTPERQLAMAYSEHRTLELRVPQAAYAVLAVTGHTRGAAADHEPAALLDARARLTRELERSPNDPHLLELEARADVLEERYDPAVDVLDRLLAVGPVTADLLADAAAAYYQRGLVNGNELDRSTALDYLRRADGMAPTDPVILFNEGIVMEDRGQVMNAVEVWNRYLTVERDAKWSAEGKRRLEALEQTLNRLKSHQSRIDRMLATPAAMDALAGDTGKLASLDEELASYELDKLLLAAYPLGQDSAAASSNGLQPARGSPCTEKCTAARRLLKALGKSLELQHHDPWLTDLLSPDINSLPAAAAAAYSEALALVARSLRKNLTGAPTEGESLAMRSRELFRRLETEDNSATLTAAARVGELRAAVEYMFSLQLQVDFQDCRAFAQDLRRKTASTGLNTSSRYPWIEAAEMTTERNCDDTPETRLGGRALESEALRLTEADRYPLLAARIRMRIVDDAADSGDVETAVRLAMATLHQLYAADVPVLRITGTISSLFYVEQESPRPYVTELTTREEVGWFEVEDETVYAATMRLALARAEMRIGSMREAENQMDLAYREADAAGLKDARSFAFFEYEVLLSEALLERGDLTGAKRYLDRASARTSKFYESWGLHFYAAALGQLELAQGSTDEAAHTLETEIRSSEGKNVDGGDRATAAEYAQLDHDLYAELAAVWLKQGRSPESVLALWERFRMRSRGLAVSQCAGLALDCDRPRVAASLHRIGDAVLMGQVVLLDRVLVYRADKSGVRWSEKPLRRQDVLDASRTLERVASSPSTTMETVAKLGTDLSDGLLPQLPAKPSAGITLLLEPDPLLQSLPWPALPTPAGPLGLAYSAAEVRSIAAMAAESSWEPESIAQSGPRALVVGASLAADGEPPLPETLKEAESVDRILHAPDLLLGERATAENLAVGLGSATIFHFAGHAVQTRNGTRLQLAGSPADGQQPWVDGAFLRQHPPRACRLAVLSGCSTGVREASWNHPSQDLVETLGDLGVPEVVATRWQINSEAAVPFMSAFYGELSQGNSAAVALTSARRVLSSQSLYSNPYYWGAYYVMSGEMAHTRGELRARRESRQEAQKEKDIN